MKIISTFLVGASAVVDGPRHESLFPPSAAAREWTPTSTMAEDEVKVSIFRNACTFAEKDQWAEWGLPLDKQRMLMGR